MDGLTSLEGGVVSGQAGHPAGDLTDQHRREGVSW